MDETYPSDGGAQYDKGAFDSQVVHEQLQRALHGNVMRERTKLERLKDAKKGLEAKLAQVNDAIRLMEENPKIAEIIHAMERAGV